MSRTSDWVFLVGIGGWLSLFFVIPWVGGEVYGTFDLSHITIAIEDLYARYQAAGEIPVWAPEFQGGFPMMANGFQSFFYIPHLILRSFLPGVWVANISLLLHLWLGVAGMWLLLKHEGFDRWSRGVAALIFTGGGYFIGHITLPHLFYPAAWLPLILWLALRFWDRPGWPRLAVFSAAIGAQLFAGHIQMFFYSALLLLVTALILLSRHIYWMKRHNISWRFKTPLWWAVLVPVLVWLLAAVHILPIQELLPLSKRGEVLTPEEAYSVSYPAWQTLTWLQADIFGTQNTYVGAKNEPELLLFFGVSGVGLGLLGLWQVIARGSRLGMIAVFLITAGFIIGGGEYSAIYRWFHGLPTPLSGLANPGRAVILVHLGWSILVSYGANGWLGAKRFYRLRQMAGVLLVGGVGVFIVWRLLPTELEQIVRQTVHVSWFIVIATFLFLSGLLPRIGRGSFLVALVAVELLLGGWNVNPVVPASSLTAPLRVASLPVGKGESPRVYSHITFEPHEVPQFEISVGPRLDTRRAVRQTVVPQRNGWNGTKVGLTWDSDERQPASITVEVLDSEQRIIRSTSIDGDLVRADEFVEIEWTPIEDSAGKHYTVVFASTAATEPVPHVVMYANTETDFNVTGELFECVRSNCRVLGISDTAATADVALTLLYDDAFAIPAREALVPLFGESFGYKMIRGHMQLQLMAVHRYLYELGERDDFKANEVVEKRTLLDRFAAGWIVALFPEQRFLEGLSETSLTGSEPVNDQYVRLYRNERAWSRVAVAQGVVEAATVDAAREKLVSGEVGDTEVVVVGFSPATPIGDSKATLEVTVDRSRELRVVVASDSSQLLVVRDVVFPGWVASIDGVITEILTVDSLFRGVVVPPGEHVVEFFYRPRPYTVGAWLSTLGWLVILSTGFYEARRIFI